ncbi:MAG: hypothetical protein E7464_00155 [Ruminococcaceae bacterium]|nr:hypothetical protein [Oscillospiraceae bacterium]
MNYRRFFAILLAAAMLLALFTGCGKKNEESAASNQPVQYPGEIAAENETDYIGTVAENTYTNPYFGISCEAPEGWSFYDEETILATMGYATDKLGSDMGDGFLELLETSGTACVMVMAGPEGESANVVVQQTQPAMLGIDDDALYPMLVPSLESQYEQMGLETEVSIGTATFLGEARDAICTTYASTGMIQKQIYIINDLYSGIVTASAYDEATVDAIMAMFH